MADPNSNLINAIFPISHVAVCQFSWHLNASTSTTVRRRMKRGRKEEILFTQTTPHSCLTGSLSNIQFLFLPKLKMNPTSIVFSILCTLGFVEWIVSPPLQFTISERIIEGDVIIRRRIYQKNIVSSALSNSNAQLLKVLPLFPKKDSSRFSPLFCDHAQLHLA